MDDDLVTADCELILDPTARASAISPPFEKSFQTFP
jgi:hypothetical protein